jgi:hypothetical protein
VTDGNGDGAARSDIGAHEYQPPPRPPTAVPLPAPAGDTTSPVLTSPSLSRTVFRAGTKSTPVGARRKRAPRGTTVRFRLSEPAAVRMAVERRGTGRRITRQGKRVCVRRTRSNRSRRACVRYTGVRTLVRRGRAGRNAVSFTGRIRGRALTPGRYRMRLWATDAARNRSAPRTLTFRIVR